MRKCVSGYTNSTNFPLTGEIQSSNGQCRRVCRHDFRQRADGGFSRQLRRCGVSASDPAVSQNVGGDTVVAVKKVLNTDSILRTPSPNGALIFLLRLFMIGRGRELTIYNRGFLVFELLEVKQKRNELWRTQTMRTRTIPAWAALALSSTCVLLQGQTTFATITGTVIDQSGAVVPKAVVTATNLETNYKNSAESNESGAYTIPQLREGSYTLEAKAPGFQDFRADKIVLAARDMRRIDIRVDVTAVSTNVEVNAGATLIETETARIRNVKTFDTLSTVPLNARWIWAYLNLSSNVISGPEGYRFGGARQEQSNWTVDGTSFNDGASGSPIGPQGNYIESFQEMNIGLANNSAEFGAMGQLTVTSKAGTNVLHGNAGDYYSTPWFRARNPFALARGTGVNHLYAGSLGGPVFIPKTYNGKNRTFFFASYEGSIGGDSTTTFNPTVPLAAWRNGDFSGLLPGTVIYDPTTKQPFEGNKIPANRINPVAQKIQDRFYPLPNFGSATTLVSQNFRQNVTRAWDAPIMWVARGDHRFSERDFIFSRFTFTRGPNTPYEGNLPAIGQRKQRRDTRTLTGSYTHTIRPNLVSETRYGMTLNNNPVAGPINGLDIVKDLGLVGLAPDLPNVSGLLKVSFAGLGLQGISQADYTNPGFRNHGEQFQEHVSWFRGRHSVKVGLEINRLEWDDYLAAGALFGSLSFSNQFTSSGLTGQGNAYADFLLGIPTSASRAFPPIRLDRNRWQYEGFVMDDFKVSSKLTLNLGVRYEYHTPWRENHGFISVFDLKSRSIVVPNSSLSKISPLYPKNYLPIIGASAAGLPDNTLIKTDRNNFAPRIGLAFRPWTDRTVFRAGYGIYYDVLPFSFIDGGSPFVLNELTYTNPVSNPDVILPRVYPTAGTAGPSSVGIPGAVRPDLQMAYSMQYNITIERQQWETGFRLTYLGANTRQGVWGYNYNSPIPDARPFVDKPRPYPNLPDVRFTTNGAGHQYNALTTEVTRQTKSGLYLQSSWTWARDIYDLNSGGTPENSFDRQREVGVAQSIPTHRWVTSMTYQLPFGKGRKYFSGMNRAADLVVGGWNIGGVYSAQTGQFLTAQYTGPDTTGTVFTASRTPAQVTRRPDQLRDPNLPDSERSVTRWFDAGAFGIPAAGRFGTASKGNIKGPGINCFNLGVYKQIRLTERMNFNAELSAINVMNHPNWSNPAVNISQAANVGVISGVGGVFDSTGARALRLGLKLYW